MKESILYDHKAEYEIVKRLFQSPNEYERTTLEADDFHNEANRELFSVISYLRNSCDIGTVRTELEKRGKIDAVGGLSGIADLLIESANIQAPEYYEAKLKDLAERRAQVSALKEKYERIIDLDCDYRSVNNAGIFTTGDIEGDIWLYHHDGDAARFCTPSQALDQYFSTGIWDFIVVTGIPGHGKSEFVDWIALSNVRKYGHKIAFFSPENYPLHRHAAKLIEKIKRKPFRSDYEKAMTPEEIKEGIEYLRDKIYFIYPDDESLDIDYVLNKFKMCKAKYGIDGVVLDPFTELDWNNKGGMNQTDYIGQCLTKMRRFARIHDVYFILVAHPRIMKKDDDGYYIPPTMYDISGSANFNNKADIGVTVYRDPLVDGKTTVYVNKMRFKGNGKIGECELNYNIKTGEYSDVFGGDEKWD